MFNELIQKDGGGVEYPELNGAFTATFVGVTERKRKTFETRNAEEPEYEDVFVFEFEVSAEEAETETPIKVSKWVRKPSSLRHPSNGKVSNLYKVLASLYGVAVMTDEQLNNAEEFVKSAVGREYQLTLQTKPNGWIDIVHIAPVRRKQRKVEEAPF